MLQALRNRIGTVIGLLVSGVLGMESRSGALPAWWAKYAGVALWACALYWLVRTISGPSWSRSRAAVVAFIGSWVVEFLQLTAIPHWVSSKHWLLRVMFGDTFSVWDLPAYVVGVGVAFVVDTILAWQPTRRRSEG